MRSAYTLLCLAAAAFFMIAAPAAGQTEEKQEVAHTGVSVKAQKLRHIIEVQQRQIEVQKRELEVQKKMLHQLQQQVQGLAQSQNHLQGQQAGQHAIEPPKTDGADGQTTDSADQAERVWEESVFDKLLRDPRNRPKGMRIPDGWIPVPGRQTDVRFGGFVQANFIHDFQDAGYSYGLFIPSQIPVPTDDTTNTEFDPRTSRLTFETRTPGARDSYYNTFFSIDFNGQSQESSVQPRLRQAYLSGVGLFSGAAFTVGQTWTTFQDLNVYPDIFDLEGPNAMTGLRQVLARYSFTFGKKKDLVADVALEQPETAVQNGTGLRKWPDAMVRFSWHRNWGHLMAVGLGRQLSSESLEGTGEDSAFGWGLSLSGQLKVPDSEDNFQFQVQGGSGVGRYVFDLGSAPEGQDAFYDAAKVELTPLKEFGAFAAYQHYWTEKWRSTLVGGYLKMKTLKEQPDEVFEESIYTVGNLVYRLHGRLDIGLEYYWGQRKNKDDRTGYANRLMLAVKYPF